MAEQVVKYSEWLTQTRESSAYKYFAMGWYGWMGFQFLFQTDYEKQ